jgi:hypothetical protein
MPLRREAPPSGPSIGTFFTQPIEERLKGLLLDRTNWLELFSLAQRKVRAHQSCRLETKRRFRSWVRSGLTPDAQSVKQSYKRHKSPQVRGTSSKGSRDQELQLLPPGQNTKRPRLASTSADVLWSGNKRKRPPDEFSD